MSVVLAHSSTLVGDVLTRALVVLGLDARHDRDRAPHQVFVCDAALGEQADLVLTTGGQQEDQLDVTRLHDAVMRVVAGGASGGVDAPAPAAGSRLDSLTAREQEVLSLIATGASNRQIATSLSIAQNTARTHVQNLLAKLEVESRLAAAALARRHGLAEQRS